MKISPLSSSHTQRSHGLASTDPKNTRHKIYTGSGHRCGVIPYSSVVWWIASWDEDEQLQGKNNLLRRGVLVLGELVVGRIALPLSLWWLVLFIEALVLSPNIEREGSQQGQFLKGTTSKSYPDKRWSSPAKGSGGDAVLGSTVTFVLPSCWSWSRCTDMETFA